MNVKSREEAWRATDRLFPTDYEQNDIDSRNAGYPIYTSTMEGNGSWISDLNTSLEVNVADENGYVKTTMINIEAEPEITEETRWSSADVRECCIRNDFYTAGDIKAYEEMLGFVEKNDFSTKNLYKVAKDIEEHSEDQTIENVMFCLRKDAVNTFYTVRA